MSGFIVSILSPYLIANEEFFTSEEWHNAAVTFLIMIGKQMDESMLAPNLIILVSQQLLAQIFNCAEFYPLSWGHPSSSPPCVSLGSQLRMMDAPPAGRNKHICLLQQLSVKDLMIEICPGMGLYTSCASWYNPTHLSRHVGTYYWLRWSMSPFKDHLLTWWCPFKWQEDPNNNTLPTLVLCKGWTIFIRPTMLVATDKAV